MFPLTQQFNIYSSDGKESSCKVETRVQSLGWEDPLEKEMATHSSIPVLSLRLYLQVGSITHTELW